MAKLHVKLFAYRLLLPGAVGCRTAIMLMDVVVVPAPQVYTVCATKATLAENPAACVAPLETKPTSNALLEVVTAAGTEVPEAKTRRRVVPGI